MTALDRRQVLGAGGIGLLALIDQLQRRVTDLERRPATDSEASQPNYLRVTANGQTAAVFPGGVLINEDTSASYNAIDSVGWQTTAGAVPDFIKGYLFGGTVHNLLLAVKPDANDAASLNLAAQAAGAAGATSITAGASDNAGGNATATVLDSLSRSTFVQLTGALAEIALAFGETTLAFNGVLGQNLTIAHGLGRVPKAAGVWAVDGSEFLTVQQSAAHDVTNLYVSANVNGSRAVDWAAIG